MGCPSYVYWFGSVLQTPKRISVSGVHRLLNITNYCHDLSYSPELNIKTLLLKTAHAWVVEHGEINLYSRESFISVAEVSQCWEVPRTPMENSNDDWTQLESSHATLMSSWHTVPTGGTNVTGVINNFLALRLAPNNETHTWHCYCGQEPVSRQVIGYKGEATVILLNGHSIKLIPNGILRCS